MKILWITGLLTGCSSYEMSLKDAGASGAADYDASSSTTNGGGGVDNGDTAAEQEDDFLKLEPASTTAYVFVANTTRNTVSRISVPSLAVLTTEVGKIPSMVLTTSDYLHAVTLNEGSDSVSIIDAETLSTKEVSIRPNFNAMGMSGDGKWVMCWYDPDRESQGSSGGVQSFNEVSLVNLETGTHIPMVVGFNPKGVQWTEDGKTALVVSDASLATVDLSANPPGIRLIELSEDPLSAPAAQEVEISPDGNWAFVRQEGEEQLALVNLVDRYVDHLDLGGKPTDMDLSPDKSRISIVSRDAHSVFSLDPSDPYATPRSVSFPADSSYGAVLFAGSTNQAVLYTNALPVARYAVWNLDTDVVTERPLVKPVQTMGISPTGGSLLIFHTKGDAPDASPDNPFNGHWALSLVDLGDFRSNPLQLPAEPTGYSVSDDGHYGFFMMDGQHSLETLTFDTLLPETIQLPSQPAYIGVLPGTNTAYASQEYDLGRISFYDAAQQTLDTITGFELNSDIQH